MLEIHVRNSMSEGADDVVGTLVERHEHLAELLATTVAERAAGDERFRADLTAWASALGVDDADTTDEETVERVADLIAYRLLVDRLHSSGSGDGSEETAESFGLGHSIRESRDGGERVLEHDEIDAAIPLNAVDDRLDRFVDGTDRVGIDPDVIGGLYERVLPEERRAERGTFYTPPTICDLLARVTIRDADDAVLDPACGAGSFLVAAIGRKQTLATDSTADASVGEVTGIDVSRFPTRLATIGLARQAGVDPAAVDVRVSDFFDVTPPVEGYDAVLGNPPYVRGRSLDLDYKDAVRKHLSAVDAEWLTRKMDLYGYFLTHATAFLREGGRLGFVLSDRWLDTRYGTDLQRFVLEHYRIEAVLTFRTRTFSDALVGVTVVVLERERDPKRRAENVAKFVAVRNELSVDQIAALVERDAGAGRMVATDEYRLVATRQRRLRATGKWNAFFAAPPIYFDLPTSETVELGEMADLRTGLESGDNDFFYRRWDDIEALGLSEQFTPLLKASGQVEQIRFDGDSEWGVFDVSALVEAALAADRSFGASAVEHVKGWLAEHGHDAVLDYVEWGEDEGHDDGSRRCRRRNVWFCIDGVDSYRPPLAFPLFCWHHHRVVRNESGAVTDRQFHPIYPHDRVDERVLCGILNSRVTWLIREIESRHAGGQAMTRLQTVKYEAAEMAIPDPTALTRGERDRVVEALEALTDHESELVAGGVTDPETRLQRTEAERDALDRAVLATLGMADRLDELKRGIDTLVDARKAGAGDRTSTS